MQHPSHTDHLVNLKKIEGQIRGIQNMIDERQYCIAILNQIKAVRNALTTVEGKILNTHLKNCVKDSLTGSQDFDAKIDEIVKILKR